MKTEDFDDAIRRKIENISPLPEPGKVDAVHSYVKSRQGGGNWSSLSRGMGAGALVLIFGILLTWGLLQRNENVALQKNVEVLSQKLKEKGQATGHDNTALPTDLREEKSLLVQVQTPGTAEKNIEDYNQGKGNSPDIAASETKNGYTNPTPAVRQTESANSSKVQLSERGVQKSKSTFSSNVASGKNSSANSSVTNSPDQQTAEQKSLSFQNRKNGAVGKESENEKSITAKLKSPGDNQFILDTLQPVRSKESVAETAAQDSSKEVTEVTEKNNKSGILPAPEPHSRPKRSFGSILKGLQYSAGIEGFAANRQTGFGFLTEIGISPEFSVDLGLNFTLLHGDIFSDDDLHDNNRRSPRIPGGADGVGVPDSQLAKLQSRYQVLQLPVRINYSLPLRNNFILLFSVGTDLDLAAMQHFECDVRNSFPPRPGGPRQAGDHLAVNANHPVLVFNNAVAGIGIEKSWSHLALQLQPYVNPNITEVRYREKDLYYGLRSRLLYRF